jgi:hypothetical protein
MPFSIKIISFFLLECIIFAWIYAGTWMIPQFFSPTSFVLEGFQTQCSFNYIDRDFYTRSFMILMFGFGLILPLCLIIIFYLRILYILKKNKFFLNYYGLKSTRFKSNHNNNNNNNNNNFNLFDENGVESIPLKDLSFKQPNMTLNSGSHAKLIRNEIRLIKSIILNIVMFCVAWFPYAIITLLAQFGPNIENYINPYSTSLPSLFAKMSSVYNPAIFINLNKKCQNYIKKIIKF